MPALYLRQGLKPLLCVLVVLVTTVIVSCATSHDTAEQPVKSPNDDYHYRVLTLDNDLEVLLISDPGTPKAAAALDVLVGSGDNPVGRGGLAHFLEHMLFLGTDKYPDAAEYEQYITEHGGSRNAYTSFEHTNYFFDVNAPFLPEALDRFAQFFIAPRFDAQYVDREKNAVEAEYQMGLKSDARRGLDVLQEVMNQKHPYSQFSVGSLDTLADRPDSRVRGELISFYEKHYSANAMRLVVLGAESLDELEALVTPMFSLVPNKSFQHEVIEAPIFAQDTLPMFVQVQPLATLRQLQVSFPIADYRDLYSEKPVSYLGNLVGHEGEGSLLSQLKAEGLAESLSAGAGLGWRGGALFSVSISLTEKGAADYDRVLQLLYAYMDMLRDKGPREWLYAEQSRLADLSFRFHEQVSPINYVSSLAGGMHTYSAEDFLRGPYVMDRYDEDILRELLGRIVPDNALVILDDRNVTTDQISERYQVPYASQAVSGEQLVAWQSAASADVMHLPAPNKFIAEDISLVSLAADNPAVPEVALQSDRQKIWFVQDDEFRLPKGATYINFRSPEVGQSVEQTAAAALYTALLMDELNEFAYPARLAGLSFNFYKHAQGISLRMSGYNDKQTVLLQQLLAAIARPAFDQQRFDNIRQDMIRGLRNTVAKRPSSQVMDDLREALLYGEWGEQAMIAALEQQNLDGLRDYVGLFWSTATAEALIYGNYDPRSVAQLSDMIAGIISATPVPAMPDLKVLKLSAGESLQYAVDVPHDDSVVAWYLQGEGDSWQDRAATALTAQIMKSGFFQQLRTEQQLGYVAAAFAWPQMGVPGMIMLIQSPVADANTVAEAMQAFMLGIEPDLNKAQFERHQAALVSDILRPDKNLWERAEFYWQSIARKQLDFAGRQDLAAAVESFTLQSWLAYYNRVFLQQRHSLQVVTPGRWDRMPEGDVTHYDSAEAIKSGHDAYIVE
ncbi:MAG: peptidase M16 [Gammaproteobacteria bacterium]|nr:MAG: peptidase M16 [Gammaproteobacteria bacterium]RLA60399.1 MAG: peptidase M16 [Gammaproteobacteria bacterium]